ncbi:hypothetical protein DFQ26_007318 [Actinomortierella ambigua]|nr:hypothetical protein DFQ26_007318 [Actinomortierella ambigua]
MLIKSLVVLCSAAVVMVNASMNAVVSGAVLVGRDTADYGSTAEEIFSTPDNHISALASVAMASAEMTAFRPAEEPPKALIVTFEQFVRKFSAFPAFRHSHTTDVDINLNGSFTQFEKAIRDHGGAGDSDSGHRIAVVARGLRDLIPGYNRDSSLKTWLLNVLAMDNSHILQRNEKLTFTLARITLHIAADATHTTYIPKQAAHLVVSTYTVDGNYLINNAAKLVSIIPIQTVLATKAFLASPKVLPVERFENAPVASCRVESEGFGGRIEQELFNWL